MSIGQKFEKVADAVHEKGYTKGGLDASPQETVSGEMVAITDISPIEHTVDVKASSNNLFKTTNYSKGSLTLNTGVVGGNTATFITTDFIYLPSGNYILSNITGANLRYVAFYNLNKEFLSNTWINRKKAFKFNVQEDCFIRVDIEKDGGVKIDNFDTFMHEYQFMLKEGTTATPYTPYVPDVSVATLKVYEKNLFDISTDTRLTKQEDGSYINNAIITASNKKFSLDLPYGTYTISYDLKCPSGTNARLHFILKDGTNVDTYQRSTGDFVHFEKVITGEIVEWHFGYSTMPQVGELTIKNVQLEVGSVATPYEDYKEPTSYPIAADGTVEGVTSIYPNMTITTDTDGVIIEANYYQDGKKVKENLIDMILSLGGVINE